MKIIKQGAVPKERVYITICEYCNTQFEFSEKEAKTKKANAEDFLKINCPLCKKIVEVEKDDYVR
jgi:uncharacterized protein with PIN domain